MKKKLVYIENLNDFYLNHFIKKQIINKESLHKIKILNILHIKKIILTINLRKLTSLDNPLILETLILLDLITGNKSYINSYKSKHLSNDINFKVVLRKKHMEYILNTLYFLVFPRLIQKNLPVKYYIYNKTFSFFLKDINVYPQIPNIFYK